jgi:hypothetical protein
MNLVTDIIRYKQKMNMRSGYLCIRINSKIVSFRILTVVSINNKPQSSLAISNFSNCVFC